MTRESYLTKFSFEKFAERLILRKINLRSFGGKNSSNQIVLYLSPFFVPLLSGGRDETRELGRSVLFCFMLPFISPSIVHRKEFKCCWPYSNSVVAFHTFVTSQSERGRSLVFLSYRLFYFTFYSRRHFSIKVSRNWYPRLSL